MRKKKKKNEEKIMTREIDTEGNFDYRIKPKIEHGSAYLNRAIEELQQIIISNKDSAEQFTKDFAKLQSDIAQFKDDIRGAKVGTTEPVDNDLAGKLGSLENEVKRIEKILSDRGIK